jgi:hypothetical protein
MMLRIALVALIALATTGFVIGTSIERHDARHEPAAESHEARESAAEPETHAELRPLGIDIEALPFVVLAAAASLALAALGWLRPRWLVGLIAIAAAMLAFSALDIREIAHQADEHRTALAVLAGVIAAMHLGAAAVAATAARARQLTG